MRKPIVTLTTDFGVRDHFVGVMKGVILSICPESTIVDISHDVHPFEISEAAFLIAQAHRYFPPETAHVVVVDPGVGTARRPILVEAEGQYFIGPDNGVLAMVYLGVPHTVRTITADKYFHHPVSRTFHGRDIFSPIAAHVANGVAPSSMGEIIDDHLKPTFTEPERVAKRSWVGSVLHVDRFGNLITNFRLKDFDYIRVQPFEMSVGIRKLTRLALTYAEVEPGDPFVIAGSSGYLEIAANRASAARELGCGTGAPCELTVY